MKKPVCLLIVLILTFGWLPMISAQQLQVQGTLLTDSSQDESILWVHLEGRVAVDQLVVLESRDRTHRASYRVRHVFENHILLEDNLQEDWIAGSRVWQ